MTVLGYTYIFTHQEIYDDHEEYTSTNDIDSYTTLRATFNAIKHILKKTMVLDHTIFRVDIDSEVEEYEGKRYNKYVAYVGDKFSKEIIIIRTLNAKEDPGDISDEYLIEDSSEEENGD